MDDEGCHTLQRVVERRASGLHRYTVFIPLDDGGYWRIYRQFCTTLLIPFLLMAHLGIHFQPLLRSGIEGIPPEEDARYFYGTRLFKRGILLHIWFPAKPEQRMRRREKRAGSMARAESHRRQPETVLLALLDSLRRIEPSHRSSYSDWLEYTESHSYDT